MTSNPWQQKLSQAHSADELVDTVNGFLSDWASEDLRELPVGCAPGHVADGRDIRRWAAHLSEVYCAAKAETSPQHRRMLAFFVAALDRQAVLAAREAEGAAAIQDLFSDDSRPSLFERRETSQPHR